MWSYKPSLATSKLPYSTCRQMAIPTVLSDAVGGKHQRCRLLRQILAWSVRLSVCPSVTVLKSLNGMSCYLAGHVALGNTVLDVAPVLPHAVGEDLEGWNPQSKFTLQVAAKSEWLFFLWW